MAAPKKKRKNKGLKLLILLVVCAGLFCGLYFLNQYNNKKKQEDNAETTQAAKERPVELDPKSIASISVRSKTISGKYERDFEFDAENNTWLCQSDKDIPLKQSLVKGLLSNATKVTALRTISDDLTGKAADYGLDDPEHTVVVTDNEGKKTEMYLGSKALTGDYYYFAVKGDEHIYQINTILYNYVKRGFNEFVDAPAYPSMETMYLLSCEYKDADTDLTAYYNPADLMLVDAMSISMWYYPTENEGRYISAGFDQGKELSEAVTGISFATCLDYKASDAELAEYGLTDPQATIRVRYRVLKEGEEFEEKEFKLLVGNRFEDGGNPYFYACMEGQRIVYKANGKSGICFFLEDYNMERMLNLWPCQINIACVDHFVVKYDGITTNCSITVEKGADDKDVSSFFVNGKPHEENAFRTFFSKLIMLQADHVIPKDTIVEDAEIVLDYEFFTIYEGEPTRHIQLLTYNDNYYQLAINGEIIYLVTRGDALEMFKTINEFRKTL